MNKKISLINDMTNYNRMSYLDSVSIISVFGDRAYIDAKQDEKYNAFISGYIKDSAKMMEYREVISDAKLDDRNVLYLCDPVMGDNGKRYDDITDEHIENYKKLIEISDIVVPNFTEAMILADMPYDENYQKYNIIKYENDTKEKVDNLSKKIIETMLPVFDKIRYKKNQITIITGIELYNAVLTMLDVYDGDHGQRQTTCNYSERIEGRSGVGNIFNTMFFETSTNGFSLVEALSASTSFINNSLRFCRDKKFDKNDGVFFEPILLDNIVVMRQELARRINEKNKNKQVAVNNGNNNKGV